MAIFVHRCMFINRSISLIGSESFVAVLHPVVIICGHLLKTLAGIFAICLGFFRLHIPKSVTFRAIAVDIVRFHSVLSVLIDWSRSDF